jgi:hypothetical protein
MRTLLKLETVSVLAILTAFGSNIFAQYSGKVEGNSFVDHSLHFAYSPPPSMQFVPVNSLNLNNAHDSPTCYGLFAARQPNKPFGIVAFTQKLNTPCYIGGTTYKEGSEFLSRIPRATGSGFKELGHLHAVLPNGFIVDELDYMNGTEFSAGVSVNVGSFLVISKCNAGSASDLAAMTKSILAIRKID